MLGDTEVWHKDHYKYLIYSHKLCFCLSKFSKKKNLRYVNYPGNLNWHKFPWVFIKITN